MSGPGGSEPTVEELASLWGEVGELADRIVAALPGSVVEGRLRGLLEEQGMAEPPVGGVRPPGSWHCGHWRDGDGACCGCGKPPDPGRLRGVGGQAMTPAGWATRAPEACPGGLPYA